MDVPANGWIGQFQVDFRFQSEAEVKGMFLFTIFKYFLPSNYVHYWSNKVLYKECWRDN